MTNRFTLASRKLISIVAIVAMIITSISFVSLQNNAYAKSNDFKVGEYNVILPSGVTQPSGVSRNTSVKQINSSSVNLTAGWYVVDSSVEVNEVIKTHGDCNIILVVEGGLTASKGIQVTDGTLTIWQTADAGSINATGSDGHAGIQGSNITINGGSITANGGLDADYGKEYGEGGAGIGGSNGAAASNITINAGHIDAIGAGAAAGIGGGAYGAGSNITINAGSIYAYSYNGGAGIGAGAGVDAEDVNAWDIYIDGGNIEAYGAVAVGAPAGISTNVRANRSLSLIGGYNEQDDDEYVNNGSSMPSCRYLWIGYLNNNDDWFNSATTPVKTSIKSLSSLKGGFKVTWAAKADVDGYQILYKTANSKTKNKVIVKSAKTSTKTIKGLKRHTTYNVKVRTYSGKVSNHSAWSKVKSIKTK